MTSENEFTLTDRDFDFLTKFVREHSGITLSASKRNLLYSRFARRLRALKLASFAEYIELLQSPEAEAELSFALNAITTNLTRFFRESHHFDHLASDVAPRIIGSGVPRGRRSRVWSAGCSSGEEPYSILLTLMQACPDFDRRVDFRLLATDLDTSMLDRGRDGVYSREQAVDLPKRAAETWTEPHPEGFRFVERLRGLAAFKKLNLMHPWPMRGPFDVIFCRNVLIYFDADVQAELLRRFAGLMQPGATLYVGHSESIQRLTDQFKAVGRTTYVRVADGDRDARGSGA